MLQSINHDYLLNTEPMQVGIDRNLYENYVQKKEANLYYYKIPFLNTNTALKCL